MKAKLSERVVKAAEIGSRMSAAAHESADPILRGRSDVFRIATDPENVAKVLKDAVRMLTATTRVLQHGARLLRACASGMCANPAQMCHRATL